MLSGQPVPRETAAWLPTVGGPLKAKLTAVGLLESQGKAPGIGRWCERYIAGRTDLAPRSVDRLAFAARLLAEHFGADRRLDAVTAGDAEA